MRSDHLHSLSCRAGLTTHRIGHGMNRRSFLGRVLVAVGGFVAAVLHKGPVSYSHGGVSYNEGAPYQDIQKLFDDLVDHTQVTGDHVFPLEDHHAGRVGFCSVSTHSGQSITFWEIAPTHLESSLDTWERRAFTSGGMEHAKVRILREQMGTREGRLRVATSIPYQEGRTLSENPSFRPPAPA